MPYMEEEKDGVEISQSWRREDGKAEIEVRQSIYVRRTYNSIEEAVAYLMAQREREGELRGMLMRDGS